MSSWRCWLWVAIGLLADVTARADTTTVHRIEADVVPSWVIQHNRYLRGHNPQGEAVKTECSMRLKAVWQVAGDSLAVPASYGVGVGHFAINDMLGTPWAVHMLQGAPLVRLSSRMTLDYELQLGLSFGWKPYSGADNTQNHVLGSRTNAYIGGDVALRYQLSPHWDVVFGYGYAHFSNANLEMPNEGLNAMGARLSLAWYVDRRKKVPQGSCLQTPPVPKTERWQTDIVLYGGWKRRSIDLPQRFGVGGFQVSPSYRLNQALTIGPSLDGIYDHSVNLIQYSRRTEQGTIAYDQPRWTRQVALGLQARAELTMPVFRASAGVGRYMVGGFTGFYETLALKIDVTRHLFFNVGYSLYNYYYSNNLMLGIGYRIGNNG